VLCDGAGEALCELTTAAGKLLTFKRNTHAEASCTISQEDDAAQYLFDALNGSDTNAPSIPQLKAYRKADGESTATLCFKGYLAPFTDEAEETATVNLTFRSAFSLLTGDGDQRGRAVGDTSIAPWSTAFDFVTVDAGTIASTLITTTNGEADTGITIGTIEATTARIRTYDLGANIGNAITDLAGLLDGFDFEVGPDDVFNVWARQGETQAAAKFEYGAGTLANLRSIGRTTQPPINHVTVLGANGLYALKTDATSIATYGRWPIVASASDVDEQTTLDSKALGLLRTSPVRTLTMQPDLALSPRPWDDFWLGDSVSVYARRGALAEDAAVRANGITVAIDNEGFETAEVPDPSTPDDEATLKASLAVEVL
jgi:hypothetical protein